MNLIPKNIPKETRVIISCVTMTCVLKVHLFDIGIKKTLPIFWLVRKLPKPM